MTAEEMFIKLGFVKVHTNFDETQIVYKYGSEKYSASTIAFDLVKRKVYCDINDKYIDNNVKKAIIKQQEELGWL